MTTRTHRFGVPNKENYQDLDIKEASRYLLEECRTVLPGVQALFGFQLIAVFNERFFESLNRTEQLFHLLAIILVAVSVALVMAPASYHREVEPYRVSAQFVKISSIFLLMSLMPLAVAISIDFSLIALLIIQNRALSIGSGLILWCILILLWFGVPFFYGRKESS